MDHTEKLFRELRDAWFESQLMYKPHGREWGDESHEQHRNNLNAEMRLEFERQTDQLLEGKEYCVAPTAPNYL